jgi:hypothetical protein
VSSSVTRIITTPNKQDVSFCDDENGDVRASCPLLTFFSLFSPSALLLAVTWQVHEDTEALRQVDFKTSCDIMKSWVNFQEILTADDGDIASTARSRTSAASSMLSKDDLKSLKEHSRRAINAVAQPKDKMIAVGMLIHATYHLGILSAVKDGKKAKQCLKVAKKLAQAVFAQYMAEFQALHTAAQEELYSHFRGIFSDKMRRRNLLMQYASLGHMVYLLPPSALETNDNHPRFDKIDQAATRVLHKLRSVGFASRLVAYPLDQHPPCYGTFQGHDSTVFCCDIFDDPGTIKLVSGSNDGTLKLFDVGTGQCYNTLRGHTGGIHCVAVIHNTRQVVSGSSDATLKIWNLSDGECVKTSLKGEHGHTDWVHCLSVFENENGTRIASGSRDETVRS